MLNEAATDLLLRVLEAPNARIIGSTLTEYFPHESVALLASSLLVPHGKMPVVAAMDASEDEPMPAIWSPDHRAYGYYNSVGRWVEIDEHAITAYRVDHARIFAAMLMPFERQGAPRQIDDHLWDLGSVKMPSARLPVPVWFVRRIDDPKIATGIGDFVKRRPATDRRIILTSSGGRSLPPAPDRRHVLIAVSDVLERPDQLAISPQTLAARVFPEQFRRNYPIDHSDDYGIVWLHNEPLEFRSDKQRRLLELLFDAYWAGSPVLRTSVLLFEAGYKDKTNSLSKVFSGRADWHKFIKQSEGNCWIEP